jgi:hypothetical protein
MDEEIQFCFNGYTAFSATVERCSRLQLTRLAQGYWAGNPMALTEVFINKCLSLISAQDLGSKVD